MATQVFIVSTTPANLTAALSLQVAQEYSVQNVSPDMSVRIAETLRAPSDLDAGHAIVPGDSWVWKPGSGLSIFVWAAGPAKLVVTEAS